MGSLKGLSLAKFEGTETTSNDNFKTFSKRIQTIHGEIKEGGRVGVREWEGNGKILYRGMLS